MDKGSRYKLKEIRIPFDYFFHMNKSKKRLSMISVDIVLSIIIQVFRVSEF